MVSFFLNGENVEYEGDDTTSLLTFLREKKRITSVKDGCSGQAACGACLVELNGKPALSCATSMKKVTGKTVVTMEGFPEPVRRTLGRAFVSKGAVQCGMCTSGMILTAKAFLDKKPEPDEEEVRHAIAGNFCRCTGYVRIVDAILSSAPNVKEP